MYENYKSYLCIKQIFSIIHRNSCLAGFALVNNLFVSRYSLEVLSSSLVCVWFFKGGSIVFYLSLSMLVCPKLLLYNYYVIFITFLFASFHERVAAMFLKVSYLLHFILFYYSEKPPLVFKY